MKYQVIIALISLANNPLQRIADNALSRVVCDDQAGGLKLGL